MLSFSIIKNISFTSMDLAKKASSVQLVGLSDICLPCQAYPSRLLCPQPLLLSYLSLKKPPLWWDHSLSLLFPLYHLPSLQTLRMPYPSRGHPWPLNPALWTYPIGPWMVLYHTVACVLSLFYPCIVEIAHWCLLLHWQILKSSIRELNVTSWHHHLLL